MSAASHLPLTRSLNLLLRTSLTQRIPEAGTQGPSPWVCEGVSVDGVPVCSLCVHAVSSYLASEACLSHMSAGTAKALCSISLSRCTALHQVILPHQLLPEPAGPWADESAVSQTPLPQTGLPGLAAGNTSPDSSSNPPTLHSPRFPFGPAQSRGARRTPESGGTPALTAGDPFVLAPLLSFFVARSVLGSWPPAPQLHDSGGLSPPLGALASVTVKSICLSFRFNVTIQMQIGSYLSKPPFPRLSSSLAAKSSGRFAEGVDGDCAMLLT